MRNQILKSFIFSLFALCLTATLTVNAQRAAYTATDRQVQFLLDRIETNTNTYKLQADRALNRRVLSGNDDPQTMTGYITDFESAVDSLKQKFDARQSTAGDIEDVLSRATDIDQFMQRNRLNANAERNWGLIRTDLNTLARYYTVRWDWNRVQTNNNVVNNNRNNRNNNRGDIGRGDIGNRGDVGANRPYRVTDSNVQGLITRLETRTDVYRREISTALDRSILNNTRSEEAISSHITEFENATDKLKQNFDARRSTTADVEEVLNRAYFIDGFMRDYRVTGRAETEWRAIRTDLDTLTNYYSVNWNWNRQYTPTSRFDTMLNGTYRLNTAQSDNVSEVVDRSITSFYRTSQGNQGNQDDRVRRNLERRLSSPDMLAIEKRNTQVTIASSASPQVTFDADGTARTETTANGRSIKVTAQTYYDGVALNYEGDRTNDFYVNFIPLSNGQLKVIRRVYLENRNETVTVASVYDKVNETANWSMVTNRNIGGNNRNNPNNQTYTDFAVANNTRVVAVLNTPISTKTSQDGDRFTMEVTAPSQFSGATIEGRVAKAQRSGTVSGRANVSLEFDTIRLRNGQTYRFAGIVDEVSLASGEKVTVNNEGSVRDNNQTTKTVTRAGIGAALGALIGAIAGGGQGAAIGAVVGAGAGAGTVIAQGRDDVELSQGTQFMITASAPANTQNNR